MNERVYMCVFKAYVIFMLLTIIAKQYSTVT